MFDKISDKESYWGEVVASDDPKHASRVKVRVKTAYDELPLEAIPWAIPRYADGHSHDIPAIGELVAVKFLNEDIYFPTWYRIRSTTDKLSTDDYQSATVVTEKDLSLYELDGSLSIRYTKSEGLLLELVRNDNVSTIIIRNDNSIFLKNGNTDKVFHISNSSMSMGSETSSQQPCVVGNDNETALNMLNDTIKSLSEEMNTNLSLLSAAATASPYTRHLADIIRTYGTKVKALIATKHSANANFFPETKSTIATIDKT